MTIYQPEELFWPAPDLPWDQQPPWIRLQIETLGQRFPGFLTTKPGRFYALFGGSPVARSSLLRALKYRYPPPSVGVQVGVHWEPLSVLVDPMEAGIAHVSSPRHYFQIVFQTMRDQLGVCSIDQAAEGLFEDDRTVLFDFRNAFALILDELDVHSTRILLLLDRADELAQAPFADELFTNLITLFASSKFQRSVASQLDVIMPGAVPLYNLFSESALSKRFPKQLGYRDHVGVLPSAAARALATSLLETQADAEVVEEIMRLTGGHPDLILPFIEQLQATTSEGPDVGGDAVEQVASTFLIPHGEFDQWFYECFQATRELGSHPIYAAMVACQVQTRAEIHNLLEARWPEDTGWLRDRGAVDRALDALLFYGLIRHEEIQGTSYYTLTSELCRQWFLENELSPQVRSRLQAEDGESLPLDWHDTVKIRALLVDAFGDEDLRRFIRDTPAFKDLRPRLGSRFSLEQIIDELLEYCETRLLFRDLVEEIKRSRPRQFARHFPEPETSTSDETE